MQVIINKLSITSMVAIKSATTIYYNMICIKFSSSGLQDNYSLNTH